MLFPVIFLLHFEGFGGTLLTFISEHCSVICVCVISLMASMIRQSCCRTLDLLQMRLALASVAAATPTISCHYLHRTLLPSIT